jgi:hypothetical protein
LTSVVCWANVVMFFVVYLYGYYDYEYHSF